MFLIVVNLLKIFASSSKLDMSVPDEHREREVREVQIKWRFSVGHIWKFDLELNN